MALYFYNYDFFQELTMVPHLCFIAALIFASTAAQENFTSIDNITQSIETTTEYVLPLDLSSIFQIKFYLRNDSVNAVAAQLIYNATANNITVNDLVQLTQVENLTLTDINQVLDQLDLSSTDLFNFRSLESAFSELNVSVLTLYKEMRTDFIPDPRTNVPRLLDTFAVDQAEFNDVILYGNDSSLFQVLRNANFSEENVKAAFAIIGKTPSDLYDFVKPSLFPKIREYRIERLLEIVKENQITKKHFKDALDAFQVPTEQYYATPSFRNALTDLVDEMNNVELYGTLTNFSEVATVNFVRDKYTSLRHVADVHVENFLSPRDSYKVVDIDAYSDDCLYGPILLRFEGISSGKVLPITEVYINTENHVHDCYYAAVVNDVLEEERLQHVHFNKHNLIADVSNTTEFKFGSPLICHNALYGVAEESQRNKIGFRSFRCDESVLDTTPIFADEETSGASTAFVAVKALVLLLLAELL